MIFWLVFFFEMKRSNTIHIYTRRHKTHKHSHAITFTEQTIAAKWKEMMRRRRHIQPKAIDMTETKKIFFGTIVQRNDVEHCHFVLFFCVARYHWQPTAANSICVITPNRLVSMAFCGFVDTLKSFLNINYNDLNQIELLLGHFLLRYINTGL